MSEPVIICHRDISCALEGAKRIYLTGYLRRPQKEIEVVPMGPELGISRYQKYTADPPHVHLYNIEFNFILAGAVKVLSIATGHESELGEGDIYLIPPDTPYAVKHVAGTEVIFGKTPGGDDKKLVKATPELVRWMGFWEAPFNA